MAWRHVLFANWPVDPATVRAHLPDALAVDTYDGDAWLSVVPFTNVDVRPTWAPDGWGFRLPELNLRTYVTYDGEPGIYFFSLDAEGVLGVVGARLFHHLPYYYARIDVDVDGDLVRFTSRRIHPSAGPLRLHATYEPTEAIGPAPADSLAGFLVERYRYYTDTRRGVRYADVEHDSWPLARASVTIQEDDCFVANGLEPPDSEPVFLYSRGVDTIASPSERAAGNR